MLDSWALIRFILCFFTPHPNEIQRTDQVAQVNFIPIVELDGSAKKSDSPKIAGVSHEPSSAVREMLAMECKTAMFHFHENRTACPLRMSAIGVTAENICS
jgi:hypothetical protein